MTWWNSFKCFLGFHEYELVLDKRYSCFWYYRLKCKHCGKEVNEVV